MSKLKRRFKKTLSVMDEAFYRNGFHLAPVVYPLKSHETKEIRMIKSCPYFEKQVLGCHKIKKKKLILKFCYFKQKTTKTME